MRGSFPGRRIAQVWGWRDQLEGLLLPPPVYMDQSDTTTGHVSSYAECEEGR